MLGVDAVHQGSAPEGFLHLLKKPGEVFLVAGAALHPLHLVGALLDEFRQSGGLHGGLTAAHVITDCDVRGDALPPCQHDGSPLIRCDRFLCGSHVEELGFLCYAPQICRRRVVKNFRLATPPSFQAASNL